MVHLNYQLREQESNRQLLQNRINLLETQQQKALRKIMMTKQKMDKINKIKEDKFLMSQRRSEMELLRQNELQMKYE